MCDILQNMAAKAAKKTTKKRSVTPSVIKPEPYTIQSANTTVNTPNNKMAALVVGIVVVLFALYLARGLFIAAIVNGEVITRYSVVSELEKQNGKRVLDNLVTQKLILQEAKKQNITVLDKDIDAEVARAEKGLQAQGQTLDSALAMQGMTRNSFREQIKLEKLIEAMLGKYITVTDAEVQKYIDANKDTMPQSTDSAALAQSVKQQLRQQKLGQKIQTWLADLQKKAQTTYFVSY